MTAPVEVQQPDLDTVVEEDRPWVVVVWNDPINLMNYVAYVFRKLFGYSEEKANKLMMDVHSKGRASVSTGTRMRWPDELIGRNSVIPWTSARTTRWNSDTHPSQRWVRGTIHRGRLGHQSW